MSSVVRTTTGMTMTASATAPAQPEKCPIGATIDLVDEQADHDRRRAEQDVVDEAHDRGQRANSGRIRPGRCRPGCRSACRSATASTVRIRLPTMALSRPPAAPGGGVISVKTASESPLTPVPQQRAEDQHQPAEAERGGGERQDHRDRVAAAAGGVESAGGADEVMRSWATRSAARCASACSAPRRAR